MEEGQTLLTIWSRIVEELAMLQDANSSERIGHLVNPISGGIYTRDTAFAAVIFATEYNRTGEGKWKARAVAAQKCLMQLDICGGLDEPIWNRTGWHFNKGSLATTGMAFDAVWQTMELLGIENEKDEKTDFLSYLEGCLVEPGLFAHDLVAPETNSGPVLNTTAIALYLLEYYAVHGGGLINGLLDMRDTIWLSLKDGQRTDGLWPYFFPRRGQRLYYRMPSIAKFILRNIPFLRRLVLVGGDKSIFFGDAVHHCLVLFYMLKSLDLRVPRDVFLSTIEKGWNWIRRHLKKTASGEIRLDLSWEPKPLAPRYCNFRETTSYFLILASLPLLRERGMIEDAEWRRLEEGMLAFIKNNLLEEAGVFPSIKPYDAPPEILRNILPRVGESVAWKGFLLSKLVLKRQESFKMFPNYPRQCNQEYRA